MRRTLPAAKAAITLISGAVAAITLIAAAPPTAIPPPVPGGLIGTLAPGKYACELPGNAGGPIRRPATEFDFTVIHGSSYRAAGQRGSYLLTGDVVTMTSGKLKGVKLHRLADGFLRRVEANGKDGEMRCVLATAAKA